MDGATKYSMINTFKSNGNREIVPRYVVKRSASDTVDGGRCKWDGHGIFCSLVINFSRVVSSSE